MCVWCGAYGAVCDTRYHHPCAHTLARISHLLLSPCRLPSSSFVSLLPPLSPFILLRLPSPSFVSFQVGVANDMYDFLQQFMKAHSKYAALPFYAVGESYAGHYVPAVTHKIWQNNNALPAGAIKINLKGTSVGNGLTDPSIQYKYVGEGKRGGGRERERTEGPVRCAWVSVYGAYAVDQRHRAVRMWCEEEEEEEEDVTISPYMWYTNTILLPSALFPPSQVLPRHDHFHQRPQGGGGQDGAQPHAGRRRTLHRGDQRVQPEHHGDLPGCHRAVQRRPPDPVHSHRDEPVRHARQVRQGTDSCDAKRRRET